MWKRVLLIIAIILVPIAFAGYYYWWVYIRYEPVNTPGGTLKVDQAANSDPVILAAGDIASCHYQFDEKTGELLGLFDDLILPLGNNVYPQGSTEKYVQCFSPTWGKYRDRLRPVPGNRDYRVAEAAGYFKYFGKKAGTPPGYYSYDVGDWHLIALNSNCDHIGGCGAGSPELTWLTSDLETHPNKCTLAYFHHPRYTSGQWRGEKKLQPMWQTMVEHGVDVGLSAHDRLYERLAPMNVAGQPDPEHGLRQFVVGTGGSGADNFGRVLAASEVRNNTVFGVLQLTLHPDSYDWQFLPATAGKFSDGGTDSCH